MGHTVESPQGGRSIHLFFSKDTFLLETSAGSARMAKKLTAQSSIDKNTETFISSLIHELQEEIHVQNTGKWEK